MKRSKAIILSIVAAASLFVLPEFSLADIVDWQFILMKIHFEDHGTRYPWPVRFSVECFGHDFSRDGKDLGESKKILSFSGTYDGYVYNHTEPYYGRGLRFDYCTVNGELEKGEKFTVTFPDLMDQKYRTMVETGSDDSLEYLKGHSGVKYDLRSDVKRSIPVVRQADRSRPVSPLYETRFLVALLMTILIEVPVILLLLRFVYREKEMAYARIIFVGALASMVTLPFLWFVFPAYFKAYYLAAG